MAAEEVFVSSKELFHARRANSEILAFISDQLPSEAYRPISGFISFIELNEKGSTRETTFPQHEAAYHAIKVLRDCEFEPTWLAFALSDGLSNGTDQSSPNFGLDKTVYVTTNTPPPGWTPPASITQLATKMFIDVQRGEGESGDDHKCFGFCVCPERTDFEVSQSDTSLSYLHYTENSFHIHTMAGEMNDCLGQWLGSIQEQAGEQNVVTYYVQQFRALSGEIDDCHISISATSIFRSLKDPSRRTVAQFVAGLRQTDRPAAACQLLQIILCGLPMAWSAIRVLNSRNEQLSKHRDLMENLREPLNRLSHAVRAAQRDAQTLNAALNDPSQALFASHSSVSEVFEEGRALPLPAPFDIVARHNRYKSEDDARLALAVLLSRITGAKLIVPPGVKSKEQALKLFELQIREEILTNSCISPQICNELAFLARISCRHPEDLAQLTFAKGLGDLNTAIGRFKGALFTPYKLDTDRWPKVALELTMREFIKDTAPNPVTITPPSMIDIPLHPADTPVTYAAILDFVYKVCSQVRGRIENGMTASCHILHSSTCSSDRLEWRVSFRDEEEYSMDYCHNKVDVKSIAANLKEKIEHGNSSLAPNSGDFSKPFADLTRKMLGISSLSRGMGMDRLWKPQTIDDEGIKGGLVLDVVQQGHGAAFRVYAGSELRLVWEHPHRSA